MSLYTYEMARKICIAAGVRTRDQYRQLRKTDIKFGAKTPTTPNRESAWEKYWIDWDEFLRNPDDVPVGAELIQNHYYKFENTVYNHTGKGFLPVAKRQHPDGKWMSDIRMENGKQKTIYLDADASGEVDYPTAWNAYLKSARYTSGSIEMARNGMRQPYIDNILRGAFDDGFNSKN